MSDPSNADIDGISRHAFARTGRSQGIHGSRKRLSRAWKKDKKTVKRQLNTVKGNVINFESVGAYGKFVTAIANQLSAGS
jgi:hypothetical protein